jgi:hypothetical protein
MTSGLLTAAIGVCRAVREPPARFSCGRAVRVDRVRLPQFSEGAQSPQFG